MNLLKKCVNWITRTAPIGEYCDECWRPLTVVHETTVSNDWKSATFRACTTPECQVACERMAQRWREMYGA